MTIDRSSNLDNNRKATHLFPANSFLFPPQPRGTAAFIQYARDRNFLRPTKLSSFENLPLQLQLAMTQFLSAHDVRSLAASKSRLQNLRHLTMENHGEMISEVLQHIRFDMSRLRASDREKLYELRGRIPSLELNIDTRYLAEEREDALTQYIRGCTQLKKLVLAMNTLDPMVALDSIQLLSQLQVLRLDASLGQYAPTNADTALATTISALENLKELFLPNLDIGQKTEKFLFSRLAHLECLEIGSVYIKDAQILRSQLLSEIEKLDQLTSLKLEFWIQNGDNNIADQSLKEEWKKCLSLLPLLTSLDVTITRLQDSQIDLFSGCHNLRHLTIRRAPFDGATFGQLASSLGELRRVQFIDCDDIRCAIIEQLAQFPNLTHVEFIECDQLNEISTKKAIMDLNLSDKLTVTFRNCQSSLLPDDVLNNTPYYSCEKRSFKPSINDSKITHLHFLGNITATGENFEGMYERCHVLRFHNYPNLQNIIFTHFTKFPSLTHVEFVNCPKIDLEVGLKILKESGIDGAKLDIRVGTLSIFDDSSDDSDSGVRVSYSSSGASDSSSDSDNDVDEPTGGSSDSTTGTSHDQEGVEEETSRATRDPDEKKLDEDLEPEENPYKSGLSLL